MAEALSQWLGWTDAIALSAVLQKGQAAAPAAQAPTAPTANLRARGLADAVQQAHRDLVRAITQPPEAGELTTATAAAGPIDFAPYRRHHLAGQRAMTERLGPLRARVRAALSAASPRLHQLAALDAVLDDALAARQAQLLGTVPGWLESHAKHPRRGAAPTPEALLQTLHQVLLAELETRWQPIETMMQALAQHRAQALPPPAPAPA